jgi:hypothetical protein
MTSPADSPSDLLVTVIGHEVRRALWAQVGAEHQAAVPHFLAAAQLGLVLSADYALAEDHTLALHIGLGAASCLWCADRPDDARSVLEELLRSHPGEGATIAQIRAELERGHWYPLGVALRELSAFPALLHRARDEGGTQVLQRLLARLGARRLGKPTAEATHWLESVGDLPRLRRMSERIFQASSWGDLLATP